MRSHYGAAGQLCILHNCNQLNKVNIYICIDAIYVYNLCLQCEACSGHLLIYNESQLHHIIIKCSLFFLSPSNVVQGCVNFSLSFQ